MVNIIILAATINTRVRPVSRSSQKDDGSGKVDHGPTKRFWW